MDRIISITISLIISLLIYLGFVFLLKTGKGKDYFGRHWYLHPNAVCIWRVIIGLIGTHLYFLAEQHELGILLFTISAMLDGVDGLVARECDLITSFGEELDPLCDKITYLPPLLFFAYWGMLSIAAVWTLVIIEASGQFLVRYIIKRFTRFSVAANNFGKIKAVLCFALIIYCAIIDGGFQIPDVVNQILYVCIILSVSSSAFKTISNRFYADILSLLNLSCGIIGVLLVFQQRYVYAALAVMAGQIFDLFDGRMAEKHGGTKFGPWLDDIADLVSFGVCPALLILSKSDFGMISFIFGLIYCVAVGFRLWRYITHDKLDESLPPGIFNGLPSPAGATVVLGACLFWEKLWIIWIVTFLTSLLLVSHIRFVHFGRFILRRIPRIFIIIFGFVIVFIIAYLLKSKDSGMLGGLLLISFFVYLITSSKTIISEVA